MRVDIVADVQLDMHRLRVLAADRLGAFVVIRPFIADHHHRIAETHFGMREVARVVEKHEQGFEPERLLQPAESRLDVMVAAGALKSLSSRMIEHIPSTDSSDQFSLRRIFSKKRKYK